MTSAFETALDGLLIAALAWAVLTDLRSRRIQNRLTYPLIALGLLANGASGGWSGLSSSLLGCLLGFGLLILPCLRGAMGMGDLKLLMAIGALKGPEFVLFTALYGGLAGGLLAVFEIVRASVVAATLRGAGAGAGQLEGGRLPSMKALTIPYGPAIAAGALFTLVQSWTGAG